jgi:hypothetical protein
MIKNQNIGVAKIMQRGGHFGRPFEIIGEIPTHYGFAVLAQIGFDGR